MSIIDGHVYVLMTGIARFTNFTFACYVYCMYCAVLALCVFAFPVQFYFRFKTLGQNDTVSTVFHIALWLIMIFFASFIFFLFVLAYDFHTDLASYNYHHSQIIAQFVNFDASMPFVVGTPESIVLTLNFAFSLVLFITSSLIVIYYARCISKLIVHNAEMTDRFKHLYLMMHRTLIIQAVIFFVAAVGPAMSLCLFQVLKLKDAYVLFSLGASFFAWTPVINPLVSMYLVRPYRRMLFTKILGVFGVNRVYPSISMGGGTHPYVSKISTIFNT
uniref:Serpentine Receptor, class T n=1 Tax=Panagrellus redivivus TaxID=6233 RepID=A0A7E4VXU7_PANRE